MALLLLVALVADLDHFRPEAFAGLVHGQIEDLVGDGEAAEGADCLNSGDDVEEDDCFLHCGYA